MMHVIVTEYNPYWVEQFEREAAVLRPVFGANLIEIHHIGSTSVPGLKAKPVIDMMPVVRDIELVDSINDQMQEIGYEAMGEYGLPGRRYFRKGGAERTHQVHVYGLDSHEAIARHLAFRDYLCAHPETASRYGELKAQLAQRHPWDIHSYMDGKDAFIKEVEQQALRWYANRT